MPLLISIIHKYRAYVIVKKRTDFDEILKNILIRFLAKLSYQMITPAQSTQLYKYLFNIESICVCIRVRHAGFIYPHTGQHKLSPLTRLPTSTMPPLCIQLISGQYNSSSFSINIIVQCSSNVVLVVVVVVVVEQGMCMSACSNCNTLGLVIPKQTETKQQQQQQQQNKTKQQQQQLQQWQQQGIILRQIFRLEFRQQLQLNSLHIITIATVLRNTTSSTVLLRKRNSVWWIVVEMEVIKFRIFTDFSRFWLYYG